VFGGDPCDVPRGKDRAEEPGADGLAIPARQAEGRTENTGHCQKWR
jgi:hypothetical protein